MTFDVKEPSSMNFSQFAFLVSSELAAIFWPKALLSGAGMALQEIWRIPFKFLLLILYWLFFIVDLCCTTPTIPCKRAVATERHTVDRGTLHGRAAQLV